MQTIYAMQPLKLNYQNTNQVIEMTWTQIKILKFWNELNYMDDGTILDN